MYNLTIPENSSSNCYDCIFYSFLKYFKFDYEMYNISYFYTEYYAENGRYIYRSKNSTAFIRDSFGIDIIYYRKKETDNLGEVVRKALEDSPVGIVIDPYYCSWSPFYQKAHYNHALLVVDGKWNDKKYICFDVHYGTAGYIEVDFDVLDKYCISYFLFSFSRVNEIKLPWLISNMSSTIKSFNYDTSLKIEQLLSYFRQNSRDALFPGGASGIETSVPLINLMWIAEDKKHFPIALKSIENRLQKDIFRPIYELASVSERSFTILKSMLMKYAITGVLRENSLRNIITQIYETDVLTIESMKNILGDMKWNL